MSKHEIPEKGEKEEQRDDFKRKGGLLELSSTLWSSWRKTYIVLILILLTALFTLPIAGVYLMKLGSTYTEDKSAFVERVQDLQQLTTVEAYIKAIIERTDNEVFGKSIGLNVPGTKRDVLVIMPGSIKAGIDLSEMTDKEIRVDEQRKTITITIPRAKFLGGAELYMDKVKVFSVEGIFRGEVNIEEAYDMADEAKEQILKEATEQGVLETAEMNAEKTLTDMFSFTGYEVDIKFKE